MPDRKQDRRIFLSAVSDEFRAEREMLRDDLRRPGVAVMEQYDFLDGGGTLLEKLDDYIRTCDAVLQLVGDEVGWLATRDELQRLTELYPDFAERFPLLADQLADSQPQLSYTQLEAWLALYHRLPCYLYRPVAWQALPPEQRCPAQHEHWTRLEQLGKDWGTFDDPQHLCRRVLRALHELLPQDFPAPLARLVYSPLGKLFIGREKFLQDIRQRLQAARAKEHWPNHAVLGLGGVGKTRLAVEYAWRYQDHYAAVLMVNAESRESLDRELATLAGVLHADLDPYASDPQRIAATRDWLPRHPGWLLLVDNVDTDEARQAVAGRLPEWTAGHVVITGRVSSWPRDVVPLDLHVLSGEDAAQFMLEATAGRRAEQPRDAEQAWRLAADDLGGLCLALEQAAAYVEKFSLVGHALHDRDRWVSHRNV